MLELADNLKALEKRRHESGLALDEARLWRDLHSEILNRLMSAGSPGERREALRVPCTLEVGGKGSTWTASNFGPGGVCVRGEGLPRAGAELPLEWIALEGKRRRLGVRARVAWSHGKQAGLEIRADHARFRVVEGLYSALLEAFLREV
ncbi:MAG TPA: PilZ domain-containing protein [Polyangia bacterium]|nr:PilZ domain-containing protein [Polyangia bacterium]